MDKEYRAYMIRLTRKPNWDHWRVTLEDAHKNDVRHFATEDDLLRFLARQLRQPKNAARQYDTPADGTQSTV